MVRAVIICLFVLCSQWAVSQSIFSQGEWYKLGVTETGIYKIDYSFLTSQLGVDPTGIDPTSIQLYGYGGGALPQANDAEVPVDPPQNNLLRIGLADESFDPQDYILFYAEGPDQLQLVAGHIFYEDNIYADTAYYFLTYGQEAGNPIENRQIPVDGAAEITLGYNLQYHELNTNNILKSGLNRGGSGREWFGELFALNISTERQFDFTIPGFNGNADIILSILGQSEGPSSFDIVANDQPLGSMDLDSILPQAENPYVDRGIIKADTFKFVGEATNSLTVDLNFKRFEGGGQSIARLDRILIQAESEMKITDDEVIFRPIWPEGAPSGIIEVQGGNADVIIWDVTNPTQAESITYDLSGETIRFGAAAANKVFVAFQGNNFPAPQYFGRQANQNLKGFSAKDGLIISHGDFFNEANRLAQFHQARDGLDIAVVDVAQVYTEFASGRQDITAIRNIIKYFYSRSETFDNVLLFGDCSYDYKGRLAINTNFVPTYESRNSVHPIFSYSSDDYFGFLQDHEGQWEETSRGDHSLDIGIGRIPVKNTEEARDIVNKIIRYSTSENTLGDWKTTVAYVADDGDGSTHMNHAEQLANILATSHQKVSFQKLYLDATPQEVGASEERAPILENQVRQTISEGTFFVNYIGHGNEFKWMDEGALFAEEVDQLTNRFRLPVFVTATCQFGRYDDPDFFSGSEKLLLAPNGGAIALLTTTRPVFSSSNLPVNRAFHRAIFETENGQYPRLGDLVRKTKNESLRGPVNRNFALLGDPFLQLDYPDFSAEITTVNGKSIANSVDTLSALEEVQLSGVIEDLEGNLQSQFNGIVNIRLLDNEEEVRTLGQQNAPFRYSTQENELFRGEATVENGQFNLSFILTRNTSYRFQQGRFILYAIDETNGQDANGAATNIVLGGTDQSQRDDDRPPSVDLFINDESFSNGQEVQPNSLLIAQIVDETGINISTNGINQNITLQLNDGAPTEINDFFTSSLDRSNEGTIVYPLTDLAAGAYTATIKVWDLYNNSATTSVDFVVSENARVVLDQVRNYPNPATSETNFVFEHDRPGEELEVTVQLFNTRGAVVKELLFEVDNSVSPVENLQWEMDSSINAGVYLYRISVRSTLDGAVGSGLGRLIVN